MAEQTKGTFRDWKLEDKPCPHCRATGQWYWRPWDSEDGGFTDEQNQCRACGKIWWVDGPDS